MTNREAMEQLSSAVKNGSVDAQWVMDMPDDRVLIRLWDHTEDCYALFFAKPTKSEEWVGKGEAL